MECEAANKEAVACCMSQNVLGGWDLNEVHWARPWQGSRVCAAAVQLPEFQGDLGGTGCSSASFSWHHQETQRPSPPILAASQGTLNLGEVQGSLIKELHRYLGQQRPILFSIYAFYHNLTNKATLGKNLLPSLSSLSHPSRPPPPLSRANPFIHSFSWPGPLTLGITVPSPHWLWRPAFQKGPVSSSLSHPNAKTWWRRNMAQY